MRIIKCDDCKKVIAADRDVVVIRIGWNTNIELCKTCGAPMIAILERTKLLRKESIKSQKK